MDVSYELVNSLNSEEEKLLKKYLINNSKGAIESKKYIQLFDLLRSEKKVSQEQIIRKIYGSGKEKDKSSINAQRQLRLRLNEKIEAFVLQQSYKEDAELHVLKFISMAKSMYRKKHFELTWHYLRKAEQLAKNIEQYELSARIFTLQIQYSWIPNAPDIENLFEKRNSNLLLAKKERDIIGAMALIHQQIMKARTLAVNFDIDVIIGDVLKRFNLEEEIKGNNSFSPSLSMIVGSILHEKKDYITLEKYYVSIYKEMERSQKFDRHNRDYKIKLLELISWATLKNRKYQESEKYLEIGKREQQQHNLQTFSNVPLILTSVSLYLCTGRYEKAQQMLEELKSSDEFKLSKFNLYHYYLYMNLAAIHIIQEDYTKALQCLIPIKRGEKLYIQQSGIEGAFKKHMLECILHFETGDYEYVNYRFKAQERKFRAYLADPAHIREKTFSSLLININKNPDLLKESNFISKVNKLISMKPIEPGDTEFISFNAWLKAKMENRKYYDVFLEMVR